MTPKHESSPQFGIKIEEGGTTRNGGVKTESYCEDDTKNSLTSIKAETETHTQGLAKASTMELEQERSKIAHKLHKVEEEEQKPEVVAGNSNAFVADVKPLKNEPMIAIVREERKPSLGKVELHEVADFCAFGGRGRSDTDGPRQDGAESSSETRVSTPYATDRSPTRIVNSSPVNPPRSPSDSIVKNEPVDFDMGSDRISSDRARPLNKRRRVVMDAVVVPSLTSVRRAEADRTEINQKIKLLRNPVVKKPKDTPTLSLDTIRERLRDIGYDPYPIDLEKEVLDATVTREFMSHTYGGNPQVMYPTIGKKFLDKTGMKYFMYPNLSYNPHCPEVPGAPGLLFHVDCPGYTDDEADDEEASGDEASGDEASGDEASGDEASGDGANDEDSEGGERSHTRRRTELEVAGEDDEDSEDDKKKGTDEEEEDDFESWILISRLGSGIWQYQGQYVEAPAPRLTHHEWMQQSSKVKNVWIEGISECNWGRSIRAAVALRKELGRKPTLKEKKAALSDKANRFLTVTQKDIGNAFDRGELAIYLSTMKCVGYNVDFQRDLAEKMPLFVPAPKAPRAKKKRVSKPKGKQKDKNKTNVSAPRSRKRKREETDLGNDFDSDAADDEHDVHMLYRPRGTRSRPIVL